jgi:hypothetical protein
MNARAQFEIVVDGKPHTYRDLKEIAFEWAIHHKTRSPTHDVSIRDLREDSVMVIGWKDRTAFVGALPSPWRH